MSWHFTLQAGTADSRTCSSAAADERYKGRPSAATRALKRVSREDFRGQGDDLFGDGETGC